MGNEGIPKHIQDFIARNIGAVEQLEVLLLLHRHKEREWSAEAVAKELYVDPGAAAKRLEEFTSNGFLSRRGEGSPNYRFSASGTVDRTIADVAQCYRERRVSMINLIFSNPLDHIRSFSDAFKFRKDEE